MIALERLYLRASNALAARDIYSPAANEWMKFSLLLGATHPATLGCLVPLVSKAWGGLAVRVDTRGVVEVVHEDGTIAFQCSSPGPHAVAEALTIALEGAPS